MQTKPIDKQSVSHTLEILQSNPDQLYSTDEVATIFAKSKGWLERHRWAGTGPRYLKIGRTPYYKGIDLLSFIESRAQNLGSSHVNKQHREHPDG